jgi:hypothetical protein
VSFSDITSGCVIRYPYLWRRESLRGETEGRKTRPTAVGLRIVRPGGNDLLLLFPITSKQPETGQFAFEIPETEKRRAGLSSDTRLWIIATEGNQEQVARSFHLMPRSVIGRFSRAFFEPLVREIIRRRKEIAITPRAD